MKLSFVMARTFLKLFSRDRQAIIFSLFFPIIFMLIFGLVGNSEEDPIKVGIVDNSSSTLSAEYIAYINGNQLLEAVTGSEQYLREQLTANELSLVLILPESFAQNETIVDISLLADTSNNTQLGLIIPTLEQGLVASERQLRNIDPIFTFNIENVITLNENYLLFVVPGLLAFTLLNISISGSGYNIVEFRRKGILKRLFVTPIQPRDFIGGLVFSRLLLGLIQISVLIAVAVFLLDVKFVGNFFALYFIILMGSSIFLSIGFCLGSIAKTQQAIQAVGSLVTFPQMILSGIFYPIDALPGFVQPLAELLPLSFVVYGLREIAINGLTLMEMIPNIIGLVVWLIISVVLAVKLFVWKEVAN